MGATVLSVAFQLLIGTVLFSAGAAWLGRLPQKSPGYGRHRRAAWFRAARELRRVAPAALLALSASILLRSWTLGHPALELEPVTLAWPGAFSIAGALSTSGCYLIWRAGRLESRGRRRAARRQGRLAAGAILLGAATLAALLVHSTTRHVALSLTAGVLLGVTGFAAVLAGLSGKPRPSGHVAVVFYLAALTLLAHAEA